TLADAYPDADGLALGRAAEPSQTVRVPGFLLGSTEVTWEHFAAHLDTADIDGICDGALPVPEARGRPVTGIGAAEAEAFCRSLGMRLPSANELEVAMRGPDNRQYGFEGPLDEDKRAALRSQTESMALSWSRTPGGIYDS